jgi:hypothetical protein
VFSVSRNSSAARVTVCQVTHISSRGGVLAGRPKPTSSYRPGARNRFCGTITHRKCSWSAR